MRSPAASTPAAAARDGTPERRFDRTGSACWVRRCRGRRRTPTRVSRTLPTMTQLPASGPARPCFRRRCRILVLLLVTGWLLPGVAARAQDRPDPGTAAGQDTPVHGRAADPLARLTPIERQRLRALLDAPVPAAAAPPSAAKAAAPAAPKPKTVSVAPDSLAGQVLVEATAFRHGLLADGSTFVRLFGDIALSGRWLQREMMDPASRAALFDAFWRSAAVVLVGLGAEHLLLLALRRPLRGLGREAVRADEEAADPPPPDAAVPGLVQVGPLPDAARTLLPGTPLPQAVRDAADPLPAGREPVDALPSAAAVPLDDSQAEHRSRDAAHRRNTLRVLRRVPFALLRLLLKLLPLGAFLLVGNGAATLVATAPRTQLVILAVTGIYGVSRSLWLLMDMLLAPRAPGVRLVGVTDETARFLIRWWGWLVAVLTAAICVTDVGRILDLPARAGLAITRAVVLVEHVLLAVLIWQTRHKVAASLHPPRRLRRRSFGRVLTVLADRWWVPALFFDAALWFVWAAEIRGGYARMWQLFLSSCIVILACRLLAVMLLGGLDRLFRVEPGAELRHPGLVQRAGRYYPVLRRVVVWALSAAGAAALLQWWGVPALGFFTHGTLGTRLLSALVTVLVTLVVGVLVWELVNGALDRQIGRFNDTNQAARAVRLQTLLPILRTLLFVVLGTILALTVLSEIGVDIAPLLAGAGILGVAVGFGSQKLVQDFITGIFLLVENAMQVGDSVTVAGISGTVEHLSIRTLRLRGGDGSIQIIPFSSVSTVANMSRDFAVATISIAIAFSEDTDRVCTMLEAIGAELRDDEAFSDKILADFALNGIDSLGEYAVAISGTIRCTVSGRWPVQREFNRRLRVRMMQDGVALPQAHRTLELPNLPGLLDRAQPHAAIPEQDTSHG